MKIKSSIQLYDFSVVPWLRVAVAALPFRHQFLAIDEGGRGGGALDGTAAAHAKLRDRADRTAASVAHRIATVEEIVHQINAHERRHERRRDNILRVRVSLMVMMVVMVPIARPIRCSSSIVMHGLADCKIK